MADRLTDLFRMKLTVYTPDPVLVIDHCFKDMTPQEAIRKMLRMIRDIRDDNPQIPDILFRAYLKDSAGNIIAIYDDD